MPELGYVLPILHCRGAASGIIENQYQVSECAKVSRLESNLDSAYWFINMMVVNIS